MIIAHLSAGYLCTTWLLDVLPISHVRPATLLRIGLVASVLPDLDMIYFYTLDRQQHLHHSYLTHWPLFWLMLVSMIACIGWARRQRWVVVGCIIAGCNLFLHLLLDSIVGGIRWFAPFSEHALTLVEVPARFGPSMFNFLVHWTFALEILIVLVSVLVWRWRNQSSAPTAA